MGVAMRKLWLLAVVLGLLFSSACKKESTKVSSELETVQKIAKMEQDINGKQEEMNNLLRTYQKQGGKDVGKLVGQTLTPEQKQVLEQKLQKEEGIAYKDLLQGILNKDKEVEDLKVQIQDLEKKLPNAVVVKRGDKHYEMAMAFLKEKGVDPKEAKKLIYQNNIMDELVPGFKVWHFYDNGVYGTFVTQGEASVSPYRVTQQAKQKLVEEKDKAITQKDSLAKEKATLTEQVAELEAKRNQLNQDVAMLQAEREELLKKMQEVKDLSEELKSKLNSVYYRVGDRQVMIKEGLVKDPWYGQPTLQNFKEESFPSRFDTRNGDSITISADEAKVAKINKVKVAPGNIFKDTQDYTVTIAADGKQATIKMLNKDKFKAERTMAILVN